MFLLVLPGERVLDRIADQVRRNAKITKFVVDIAVQHAKRHGTLISWAFAETCREGSPIQHRLVSPDRVDYAQISSWISLCSKSHDACKQWAGRPAVPRLKVIDCKSRTIVTPEPGLPYAALSYVWGDIVPETYNYPHLPADLPRVVEDALIVANSLEIAYLWVDRYCIWQDDPAQTHKMEQINNMGRIYGDAVITIVAAAGDNSSYGLPGVSRCRVLSHQITSKTQNKSLVADYGWDAQKSVLEQSSWFSRGWTYQEWILSTRVLLFTDYRVSFQCFEMECVEHLSHPIAMSDGVRQRADRDALYGTDGVRRFLSEFSKRHLTFDNDALSAITGLLDAWTASNTGAGHLMGVPYRLPDPASRSRFRLFVSVWAGLTWCLAAGTEARPRRRSGIPNWSCLSIQGGAIAIGPRTAMLSDVEMPREVDGAVTIELEDGTIQELDEFFGSETMPSVDHQHVPAIHLSGWCFMVGPFKKKDQSFVLETPSSPEKELVFIPDLGAESEDAILRREFEAVSPYCPDDSRCAVVFQRTPQGATRVGMLQLYNLGLDESEYRLIPHTCNPKEVFGAQRGSIRLV